MTYCKHSVKDFCLPLCRLHVLVEHHVQNKSTTGLGGQEFLRRHGGKSSTSHLALPSRLLWDSSVHYRVWVTQAENGEPSERLQSPTGTGLTLADSSGDSQGVPQAGTERSQGFHLCSCHWEKPKRTLER